MQADTEDTLVKWDELSGGPTSTKTYSLLALATLISTTPALGWKGREGDANQDRADLRAFIFGGRNEQAEHCYADIVTTVDYAGLPQFKAKKPMHYSQVRYFYEMVEQTTPKDKKDTVTFRLMALLTLLGLTKVRIPKRDRRPDAKYKYRLHWEDSGRMVVTPKYSYAEARDMILTGEWRPFLKDLQDWVIYAKKEKLVSKRKSSKGPNLSQLREAERYNQFSKLRKILLQAGMKATVNMETVLEKHP